MGRTDNVSNIQHWNSLVDKARRSGWKDAWEYFSPVGYGIRSVDRKDWYVRIMNPTFLCAIFGEDMVGTGNCIKGTKGVEVLLPRYHQIGLEVADMMMRQDHESVLAFLDSLPVYNWKHDTETGPDGSETKEDGEGEERA